MAVPIEAYSVVIRNSTIEQKYPGGMKSYQREAPNATFCADQHINRVAFMDPQDAQAFVQKLVACGLTPDVSGVSVDIAMVSHEGPRNPCLWLRFAQQQGVLITWLEGTDVGNLYAPAGWSFENAGTNVKHMSAEEAERRLVYLRTDGNIDVYRDKETGQELFVGRTNTGGHSADIDHNSLYEKGVALSKGLITIEGAPQKPLNDQQKEQLKEAIGMFERVIQINEQNWNAMWIVGKIFQRFGDQDAALQWFVRAHKIKPDQPDVAREASISAMQLGQPEQAIVFCEQAISARPGDPTLKSNLALALLLAQRPKDSQKVVREALKQNPKDKITGNLLKIIDAVVAGKRRCPRHMRDMVP